ncbi:hypothetical protein [Clostridium porci]|uniref:Uncharacterized protein n=1 Tax=Clostridium porci TaxID=2605778 RepID=A0A7X2TC69_9CLOT|nr:hypothetical protein [Clostridium porci]MSS36577.1 hypothetical protein [Clostridium porci]
MNNNHVRMSAKAEYVAVLVSEGFVWAGYGQTEDEAKEMIRRKYSEEMGERTMEELEDEYEFHIMECGEDDGLTVEI